MQIAKFLIPISVIVLLLSGCSFEKMQYKCACGELAEKSDEKDSN